MRILVVEDDALLADGLTGTLARAGHAVERTATGRHADLMLSDQPFDLVVLDVGLPDIDGFEVLRRGGILEINTGSVGAGSDIRMLFPQRVSTSDRQW